MKLRGSFKIGTFWCFIKKRVLVPMQTFKCAWYPSSKHLSTKARSKYPFSATKIPSWILPIWWSKNKISCKDKSNSDDRVVARPPIIKHATIDQLTTMVMSPWCVLMCSSFKQLQTMIWHPCAHTSLNGFWQTRMNQDTHIKILYLAILIVKQRYLLQKLSRSLHTNQFKLTWKALNSTQSMFWVNTLCFLTLCAIWASLALHLMMFLEPEQSCTQMCAFGWGLATNNDN